MPEKLTRYDQMRARKQQLLTAVLAAVPANGWTAAALKNAIAAIGIGDGEAGLIFPRGIRDAIDTFGAAADADMQRRIMAEPGFARFRVRDKVAFGVRARLEFLTPYREAERRLLFWYALPHHAPLGLRRLYQTVDLIWRAAGDSATDFNFYTKRLLLAGVIKTTMLVWLDDTSPNCQASWDFLDRRIGEVLKLGKTISLAKEWTPSELVAMVKQRLRA